MMLVSSPFHDIPREAGIGPSGDSCAEVLKCEYNWKSVREIVRSIVYRVDNIDFKRWKGFGSGCWCCGGSRCRGIVDGR